MKKKVKSKAIAKGETQINSNHGDKLPVPSKSDSLSAKTKNNPTIISRIFHHKRYWLPPLALIILALSGWYLSQTWIIRTTFSQTITYPKSSVLGVDVGNLSADQLNAKLDQIRSDFEAQKFTLANNTDKWTFDASQLGATLDVQATKQEVLKLNSYSFIDKYKLLIGGINLVVDPIVLIDNDKCIQSLTVVSIPAVDPKDAVVVFDQTAQVQPDQPGSKFNITLTCQELSKKLAVKSFTSNVLFDVIAAGITKADLDAKIDQIRSIVDKPVSLISGSYRLDITSQQLLGLLDIVKQDSTVQVSWSSARLDDLINGVAGNVNTSNSSPALGACQYLISSGGNWLDRTATKQYLMDLGTDSSRSYTLPISYHETSIGTRGPVAPGSKGTIYLTYDDGMTYADRIMNYASCYGVKVTFFELGVRVDTDAAQLRRAIAEGHAVQSHGYEHAMYDYGNRSYDWQSEDMSHSISAIQGITGVRPTYFRPPGGNRSATTYSAAAANGLNLILWDDASRDATVGGLSSSATCANVLAGAYPGASVLMHSTHYSTAEAMPCIVEGLAARGYNMAALR